MPPARMAATSSTVVMLSLVVGDRLSHRSFVIYADSELEQTCTLSWYFKLVPSACIGGADLTWPKASCTQVEEE